MTSDRIAETNEVEELRKAIACLAVEVPGDVWVDIREKAHAVLARLDAVTKERDELKDQTTDDEAEIQARGRRIQHLADSEEALAQALEQIRVNATSWHGIERKGSGHLKALRVIATWAGAALDARRETP